MKIAKLIQQLARLQALLVENIEAGDDNAEIEDYKLSANLRLCECIEDLKISEHLK